MEHNILVIASRLEQSLLWYLHATYEGLKLNDKFIVTFIVWTYT